MHPGGTKIALHKTNPRLIQLGLISSARRHDVADPSSGAVVAGIAGKLRARTRRDRANTVASGVSEPFREAAPTTAAAVERQLAPIANVTSTNSRSILHWDICAVEERDLADTSVVKEKEWQERQERAENMAAPPRLNFITGNKNKLAEVQAILGDVVDLHSQAIDVPEIQGSIEEVTQDKCRRAAEVVSALCYTTSEKDESGAGIPASVG